MTVDETKKDVKRHLPLKNLKGAIVFVLLLSTIAVAWYAVPRLSGVWAAQPPTATFSRSWYIESSASNASFDLQALGRQDAHWTVASKQCGSNSFASFTILDFGEPHTSGGVYGTYSVNTNYFWSDAAIAFAAKQYMLAWHSNTSTCRLKLAIGLSNHHECAYDGGSCDITEAGTLWAQAVNGLNAWAQTQHYSPQIVVWGAFDAETTWDGADKTRQFVDGFNAHDSAKVPLVDFGDMRPGAPLIDPDTGLAERTWTDADRYYVAWKARYDVALPEIYDAYDLQVWVGLQQNHHDLNFLGIMTEACSSGGVLSITDPRVPCGSVFNGYGFTPNTAYTVLKQSIQQKNPLYYVTSMPVPY